jgi:hypothetical protein
LSGSTTCQLLNPATNAAETVAHRYKHYGCAADQHTNRYIVGRAFLTILQTIGPDDAARLLSEVPPAPRQAHLRLGPPGLRGRYAGGQHGQYKQIVHNAFIAQGVTTTKTRTGTCPNAGA